MEETEKMSLPMEDDVWIPSHCSMCYHGCPIVVHRVDGVVVKIEGNPTCPGTRGNICPKGHAGIMQLYDPHRVKTPLKRTNPQKGVGVDPGWEEISWEEVSDILYERLKTIKDTDPRKLACGGANQHSWHWGDAFGMAFGTPNCVGLLFTGMGHMCGNGAHIASEMIHNALNTHPDIDYARYMLIVGGGIAEAYQSAIAYGRQLGESKKRGNKLVVVDVQQSRGAAMADEWVPIRPATDGAFIFGMIYTLLYELDQYDAEYLKEYTNAIYLIGDDKRPLRDPQSNKPLIWDKAESKAKEYDDPTIKDPSLEGIFETPSGVGRPAFDIFKESVKQYTPEWAEEISTVPKETIRRLAKELVEEAHIGSTITIDGVKHPYTPASVAGYRGIGAHTNGLHSSWAMEMINLLIGATRSVGGARAWFGAMEYESAACLEKGEDGLVGFSHHLFLPFTYPPETITLREYFPVAFTPGLVCYEAQRHPEKYNVQPIDTLILEAANPIMTSQHPDMVIEGLEKIPFLVVSTLFLDETAQFADIIIPSATYLERWGFEGNWSVEDDGILIQQPAVEPLYNTRHSGDLYIELADRLNIQTGENGMNQCLNTFMGGDVTDLNRKYPSPKEYVEAYVEKMGGSDKDLIWKQGHNLRPKPAYKRYIPTCLDGMRMQFYSLWFMELGNTLRDNLDKNNAFDEIELDREKLLFEYGPLPFWHPSIIESEPEEYDMYASNWRTPLTGIGCSTVPATNEWLLEVAERDPYALKILINSENGKKRNLKDGAMVWVESPHARIKGILKFTETMHPEVIGTIGCHGHTTDSAVGKDRGPNFNSLLGSGLKYMGQASLQVETTARVKIYEA